MKTQINVKNIQAIYSNPTIQQKTTKKTNEWRSDSEQENIYIQTFHNNPLCSYSLDKVSTQSCSRFIRSVSRCQTRSYGVMVSTPDSESGDLSSNLGRTWSLNVFFYWFLFYLFWLLIGLGGKSIRYNLFMCLLFVIFEWKFLVSFGGIPVVGKNDNVYQR